LPPSSTYIPIPTVSKLQKHGVPFCIITSYVTLKKGHFKRKMAFLCS